MSLKRNYFTPLACLLATGSAFATGGPPVLLPPYAFDYSDADYIGPQFGFGSSLDYSTLNIGSENELFETGLKGYVISPDELGDANIFGTGTPIPVVGQDLDNVFEPPSVLPETIDDFYNMAEIFGQADESGFQSVGVNHRGFGGIGPSDNNAQFLFSMLYSQFVFSVEDLGEQDGTAKVNLGFELDSLNLNDANGEVSEGFTLQLLMFDDQMQASLVNEFSGFYFIDDDEFFADVSFDEQDLSEDLATLPATDITGLFNTGLSFETDLDLLTGQTYALLLGTDFGVTVFNDGVGLLDSTNTISATLTVLDDDSRVVLPAPVPEPGGFFLLAASGLVLARRRLMSFGRVD